MFVKLLSFTLALVMFGQSASWADITITPPKNDRWRPPPGTILTVCTDTNLLRDYHLNGIDSPWCTPMKVGHLTSTGYLLDQSRRDRLRIYQWRPCFGCQLLYGVDDRRLPF